MEIIWHGNSCFSLKGKKATLVLDAFEGSEGTLKLKADVAIFADLKADATLKRVPFDAATKTFDWPGEAEASGVSIEIFEIEEAGGIVLIPSLYFEDIRVVSLSSLSAPLTDEVMGKLGDVDVLLLPVEGKGVLDAKSAQKMMEAIEPRIVIPMNFDGAPAEFLKLMGKLNLESKPALSLSGRSSLPMENMDLVLLEPSTQN